jgi:hypothetical protein
MKAMIELDKRLLKEAEHLTGVSEYSKLVKLGLQKLISMESAAKLALLGGTEEQVCRIPRRRIA